MTRRIRRKPTARNVNVYLGEDLLTEIEAEATRLDRSVNWVTERCVLKGLAKVRELPSGVLERIRCLSAAPWPSLGDFVRQRREAKKMTRAELARRANVSIGVIEAIEGRYSRQPHDSTVFKLATALQVSRNALLGLKQMAASEQKRRETA